MQATRLLQAIGLVAAIGVALGLPLGYLAVALHEAHHTLDVETNYLARSIERIAAASPDMWPYETVRLGEVIARPGVGGTPNERIVFDAAGREVVRSTHRVDPPRITARAAFYDSGRAIGSVVAYRSVRRTFGVALLLAIVGVCAGAALYGLFQAYPLRRLDGALRSLAQEVAARDATLRAIGDGVIAVDRDGRVQVLNAVAERLLGWTSHQARGRMLGEVYRLEDSAELEADTSAVSGRVRARDGAEHEVEEARSPVAGARGETAGHVIVLRDVTARRRAEREREELQQRLQHAQRMETIGTFSGGIAHDVNNLLTPIMGHADLALVNLAPGDPAREDLEAILAAAHRAADLVRQILLFSRREDRAPRVLAVAPVVAEALALLRSTLPATIALRQDVDPDSGVLLVDPTKLHQVVLNLCANARDALGNRSGTITVTCARTAGPAGPCVRLAVGDDGEGMSPEIVARIFEPYFTTKVRGAGTGLGLAVVQGIVSALGGTIAVRSDLGRGTMVEILMPEAAGAVPADALPPALVASGARERVLFVDDEPSIVSLAGRLLGRLGYAATVASSGHEALTLLQADPSAFDLLVTDQTMPGMTGADLLRAAHALRPGLPVVLCTGFSETLDAARASELGARGFLMKPFSAETLAAAIRGALVPPA